MDKFLIKQRIRELINIIYTQYSSTGGALHIVLDDKNVKDSSINFCLDSIAKIQNEEEKKIFNECATLLLKLSYSSRKRLLMRKKYI